MLLFRMNKYAWLCFVIYGKLSFGYIKQKLAFSLLL